MKNQVKKFVKICPNCGGTNIGLPDLKSLIYRKGKLAQPIVETGLNRRRDCNYHGIFAEVDSIKIEEFKRKLKKPNSIS